MPAPAAFHPLLTALVHLARGGEQYIDEILETPGLTATLLSILAEDGGRGAAEVVRHAKWRIGGEVLALFAVVCGRGRKTAQSLLSQGGCIVEKPGWRL